MKIPCVCDKGWHSVSAHEMVDIIGAFQRGELSRIRYDKGTVIGVATVCLMKADTGPEDTFSGLCLVELPDGSVCKLPRRHAEGRHGLRFRRGPERR